MHLFNYEFIKNKLITSSLFSLSNVISDLRVKTDIEKNEYKELFNKLESIAIVDSVTSSNAIEGIYTTENRINEIIDKNSKPLTHDEEEIAGYHDAIKYIKDNYEYLDFNEETIKKIHKMLVSRHIGYANGGQYKKTDNVIAEKYPDGRVKRIIFNPVKAKDTQKAMDELFLNYKVASNDYEIPSLILIPCVILDFLSIHPFSDGNGRVSRLLTLLLLYKANYDIGKYISFENQINIFKNNYYRALANSQLNWHDNKNDYLPFIQFTFQILYECYKEINRRFIENKNIKLKKNERIDAILLDSIVPLSKSDIHKLFPDISITTIEARLNYLIKQKKIKRIGTFKNSKYLKLK